ncbi:unnamed protein product [Fusarium venenatum]|uniref:Uncharacterized protein n=1 Tax=Fusarium venenatum TaxID=56646 RepID=A0A2L2TJC7_9HYPO|nr:uncharacterized protein FVRRES_10265 [Fusarium venenatum]CEI70188.1 unnamed protein product [Fusarium venenatum]
MPENGAPIRQPTNTRCAGTETVARYHTRFPGTLAICVDDTTTARFPILSCCGFEAFRGAIHRLLGNSHPRIYDASFHSIVWHDGSFGASYTILQVVTGEKTCLENSFLLEEWRTAKVCVALQFSCSWRIKQAPINEAQLNS